MSGTDIHAYSMPLKTGVSDRADASRDLVIGKVAPTAQQVTCTWDNDMATVVDRAPRGAETSTDVLSIRPVDGSQPSWFVCLSPKGVGYQSADVAGSVGD
jgi:hypothetical protein